MNERTCAGGERLHLIRRCYADAYADAVAARCAATPILVYVYAAAITVDARVMMIARC